MPCAGLLAGKVTDSCLGLFCFKLPCLALDPPPEGGGGGGGSPMFTLANYRNRHTAHQSLLNCHQHNLLHFVVVSNLEVVTYTGVQPITVTAILLFHFISKQLSGLFNVITRATSATIY